MIAVFFKAVLWNWMVCLAVVAAMPATSRIGKIACPYKPRSFSLHRSSNFPSSTCSSPTGIMMGAKVSVAEWWIWDLIPVTVGNLVASFVFAGLAIYLTRKPRKAASEPLSVPMGVPAE
jgi:formate transporter